MEVKNIHEPQLNGPQGHQLTGQLYRDGSQQGEKHQAGEGHAQKDRKIGIDLTGQINADEAERESPEQGNADKINHKEPLYSWKR